MNNEPALVQGLRVHLYTDPMTEQDYEGWGILRRPVTRDDKPMTDDDLGERWIVWLPDEHMEVQRWVRGHNRF